VTVGRRTRLALIILLAAVALDLARPPAAQLTTHAAVLSIHVYQRTLSPVLGWMGFRCRFKPTCSRYAAAVIARDGVLAGAWKAAKRIARCGPWTPAGTVDEP